MIKVLIADDHPVVRKGIKQSISGNSGIEVVQEAGSAREIFEFLGREKCDVVVLDITLPDQSGLEVMRVLRQNHPELSVLILTMFPEDQYAVHCLRAGAAGFINKASAADNLVEAIRKVAQGGRYVSPELAENLAFDKNERTPESPHKVLSGREFQIFCQIAAGKTQKAIASELGLSAKTISTHRFRILRKMHMDSNADIVRYALSHQLIS
jgi:DNA-binding NarL/FixJ family response regulator